MSDNEQTVREALYQHFVTCWADRLPVTFEGEVFDPPATPWVRLTVRYTNRRQVSLGGPGLRRFETSGIATIDYFQSPAQPLRLDLAGGHMQAAREVYEGKHIAGTTIRCGAAIPRERGVIEGGRYWSGSVQADFVFDEIK